MAPRTADPEDVKLEALSDSGDFVFEEDEYTVKRRPRKRRVKNKRGARTTMPKARKTKRMVEPGSELDDHPNRDVLVRTCFFSRRRNLTVYQDRSKLGCVIAP